MFKEVQDLDASVTTALGGVNKKTGKKNPTKIEGYYIGSRDVESKKARSGFAKLHIFQTADGNVGVWGKTDLDRKMTSATVGAMTRVTQTGMLSTPNGDMYKYKVEVDADNAVEVTVGNNYGSSQASHSDEATPELAEGTSPYSSDESDEELNADAAELDQAPPARPSKAVRGAAAPDAARRARVEALLASGNKTKA